MRDRGRADFDVGRIAHSVCLSIAIQEVGQSVGIPRARAGQIKAPTGHRAFPNENAEKLKFYLALKPIIMPSNFWTPLHRKGHKTLKLISHVI